MKPSDNISLDSKMLVLELRKEGPEVMQTKVK